MWEDLLVKLKLENKENAVSEINLSSNKNNVDQFIECAKRNEQTLFGNIRKVIFMLLHFSQVERVVLFQKRRQMTVWNHIIYMKTTQIRFQL